MKLFNHSSSNSRSSSSPCPSSSSSNSSSSMSSHWSAHSRSLLILNSSQVSNRGSLKSPWSRRKRKHVLTPQQWKRFFTSEGKLFDGGAKLLKKVRSGGVDPSIRSEVWPFLLGVYELNSSEDERNAVRKQKRKEFNKLRKICQSLLKLGYDGDKMLKDIDEVDHMDSPSFSGCRVSPQPEEEEFVEQPFSHELHSPDYGDIEHTLTDEASTSGPRSMTTHMSIPLEGSANSQAGASDDKSNITCANAFEDQNELAQVDKTNQMGHFKSEITKVGLYTGETESSDSETSWEESGRTSVASTTQDSNEANSQYAKTNSLKCSVSKSAQTVEDFTTWRRIIRLDAVRANAEWVIYAPAQAAVLEEKALELAEAVGLKDYDHLEPYMIFHAARLVVVLEAYAIYDPDIGYCQGMSDLLSPIISVMEEDDEAFWCFVGFMMKARHNFRLDEVGIRRQLSIVSKIIKFKDPHLYKHLEKLQAEDCFFVYRMVVVLFRRELDFEQTVCLWEVMWADQTAIRSGFGTSAWSRIRSRAPPTDDLLLYAIAACVLQRRKLIIERYNSMEEILRECNNMAGHLDVWKLLDDAHDLVVNLHDKIS
ncbi:hypothetical protein KFK09_028130 [Dendrobium nobile]|uniref:Rab-GAP TBC domain-containing protein n=1 Tax=Dendrobium nobile TaxID=94219 RepID=A0A8T3A2J2_DENNO|nr:hypothetical protein KFK09_028130 [Dendrobium nobile]